MASKPQAGLAVRAILELRAALVPTGDKPKCGHKHKHKHKHERAEFDDHARECQASTRPTWAEAFKRLFRRELLTVRAVTVASCWQQYRTRPRRNAFCVTLACGGI